MKKIYTFVKRKATPVILFLTLFSLTAFSQPPICGNVAEDFNTISNGTAGFTGDFTYSGAGQRLIRQNVIGTAIYSITTPTYRLANNASSLGYGFSLAGSEQVARIEVVVQYISTSTNQLTTVFLNQFVPNYGSGNAALICRAISLSDLPGFPTGGQYRFRIELTSNTGSGLLAENFSFDDFSTNGNRSEAPLPVSFITFEAKKTAGGVQLTWKVGGEENVARYEVERSTDGKNFAKVGTLSINGKNTYTYFDANSSTTAYYRIKNVDNDAKFKYSTITRIANGKASIVLKAFPQPVLNQLTIQHPVIIQNELITVSGADGREVKSIKPATGSMQTYIDMTGLQKGIYMIRFNSGDGSAETMKVIKQ
jgi:hypothetical protein